MNPKYNPTILLKEEKATPHSIAFKVLDAPSAEYTSAGETSPEIKKRLEAYASSEESNLSLEDIAMKLKRADEKRRQALLNRGGAVSPRIAEERRRRAKERKQALDESQKSHLKEQNERDNLAEEKRRQSEEERLMRVRKHNAKVNERCREQAERRNTSAE